eukprot:3677286-Rhodomonas_salina.3
MEHEDAPHTSDKMVWCLGYKPVGCNAVLCAVFALHMVRLSGVFATTRTAYLQHPSLRTTSVDTRP